MNQKSVKGKEVRKQIKDRVNKGVDAIKEETKQTNRLIKARVTEGVNTIKKETKETNRLIKDRVNEGVDTFKDETTDVMGRGRKVACAANRKGKAMVRAIRS